MLTIAIIVSSIPENEAHSGMGAISIFDTAYGPAGLRSGRQLHHVAIKPAPRGTLAGQRRCIQAQSSRCGNK
jgi:hypothetical protein